MKVLAQNELQVFQTKKKLSNSKQIHWIITLLVLIGIGFLFIMSELVKIHGRSILYYNIKTVHLNENNSNYKNAIEFNQKAPAFIIYESKILFGSLESLTLPKLKKDSLVLNRENFYNEFSKNIKLFKNYNSLFPANVIGIAFETEYSKKLSYTERLLLLSQLSELIKIENQDNNASKELPNMVLLHTI